MDQITWAVMAVSIALEYDNDGTVKELIIKYELLNVKKMNEDIIAKGGNMEIGHLPNSLTLIIRLRGFLKAGEFIKDQQMLHDAIRKRHIESILLDQQELKVLSQEVLAFLMHSADDFAKSGIRRMATLAPKDPFAQAGVAKIRSQAKVSTLEVMQFSSEVAAMEWLRKM